MSRFFRDKGDSASETDSSEDNLVEQEVNKLKKIIKKNRDAKNNTDLKRLLNGFDTLAKAFRSSKEVFQKQNVTFPRFYIRWLVEVEDYVNNLWEDEEAKEALSKINAAALPVIRQRLKKYVKKEKLDTLIADYRANPDEEGYETPADESDDDSDENPEVKNDSDFGDFSSHSSSSWSSDSSSSGDEDTAKERKKEKLRRCFLKEEKKTSVPSSSKS